ncbi:hypothetical protein DFQ14_11657 [Halopolyspora algeriensis]|uniref:Pyridoxamine 5'-phosphate oxidase-like protein n=1 Tax=Halopolyspora algeriensis TaxID=1500506 RepID=A0A368VES8_9ACTN|nr:hypothetical protein [Halopolyspora algeriensis]RCW39572.1 hypothetical protein DFQ14_11657 [Halopolyspora algeriensis]TQM56117.1 hypothetical protein FHU43_0906 [Halopolyspora algeriensis]
MHETAPLRMFRMWSRALVAEVCWLGRSDRPESMPVTPLLVEDVPCLALPYAQRDRAEALRSAPEVAFAITDARSLPDDARGVVAFGAVTVTDDLDGSVFTDRLLEQELVKYPPSRALADSLLLRRENWWWLPRLVVRLDRVSRVVDVPARTDSVGQALLVRDDLGLRVDTVTLLDGDEQRLELASRSGADLRGDTGPALVSGHDYTVDDFERWESWDRRGRLRGNELAIQESHGVRPVPLGPLGLLERIRRRRRMEKACRREIAAAERAFG